MSRKLNIFGKTAEDIDNEIKGKKKTIQLSFSRYKDKISLVGNHTILEKNISQDLYDYLIRNWERL